MPTSTSRLSYPDCEAFFNRALEDEIGVRLYFQTQGHARQFYVRCNTFRSICRDDNRKMYDRDHPMYSRSEYDPIQLTVVPTEDQAEWFVYARRYRINEAEIESLGDIEGNTHAP